MSTSGRRPPKLIPTSAVDPEQERLLEEAVQMVNKAAWRMKRHLDEKDVMGALKHASDMISELRTSLLSPQSYNTLYMTTTEHLRHFVVIISDYKSFGIQLHELYKLVQHCGNIIPRLYVTQIFFPMVTISQVSLDYCWFSFHPLFGSSSQRCLERFSRSLWWSPTPNPWTFSEKLSF